MVLTFSRVRGLLRISAAKRYRPDTLRVVGVLRGGKHDNHQLAFLDERVLLISLQEVQAAHDRHIQVQQHEDRAGRVR